MSDDSLSQIINHLINGTINEEDHSELQELLRDDPQARAKFRERMDLEASLHTWASEDVLEAHPVVNGRRSTWALVGAVAAIAAVLLISFVWLKQSQRGEQTQIAEGPRQGLDPVIECGHLIQQADCEWKQIPPANGRFSRGLMELTAGVAELRFDSGTDVVLESPCLLKIDSSDSAQLLAGTVFVDVTEVSNGFLLTTPEANIVDEGTQYAVSLNSESTEVHVFDGSVIWTTTDTSSNFEDRIISGEARRFSRDAPHRPHRIPFGKRQFVRRVEAEIRAAAGAQLLVYDGFENLAGKLRRGRSGFGWAGGWESAGRGHGQLAEVIDAPNDSVFGIDREGHRLLSVQDGIDMRRKLDTPIDVSSHSSIFMSLLVHRTKSSSDGQASFQVLLEPDSNSPRYTRRHSVSWGITSKGAPYVNNAGKVLETAFPVPVDQTCLLVFRYAVEEPNSAATMRVYVPGDLVDQTEPTVWTVSGVQSARVSRFNSIRVNSGKDGVWQLDELKIGTSWSAVANSVAPGK
ncbi:MAG: FecR family protein [Planctomycetaceae bacterium]|nr:FecR family protein [Planctomycetaceae bacterium]